MYSNRLLNEKMIRFGESENTTLPVIKLYNGKNNIGLHCDKCRKKVYFNFSWDQKTLSCGVCMLPSFKKTRRVDLKLIQRICKMYQMSNSIKNLINNEIGRDFHKVKVKGIFNGKIVETLPTLEEISIHYKRLIEEYFERDVPLYNILKRKKKCSYCRMESLDWGKIQHKSFCRYHEFHKSLSH